MSDPVERYYPDYYGDMRYLKNGDWVEYADYEKLEAENARLKAEVERLKAQRTQLIESAEKLFRFIGAELYGPIDHFEADWEAAKEGKPSV